MAKARSSTAARSPSKYLAVGCSLQYAIMYTMGIVVQYRILYPAWRVHCTPANNVYFTLVVYVSAFLPWTLFSPIDFINRSRMAVQRTCQAGHRILFRTTTLIMYINVYGQVQAIIEDFKELRSAVLSLAFAILFSLQTVCRLGKLCMSRNGKSIRFTIQ